MIGVVVEVDAAEAFRNVDALARRTTGPSLRLFMRRRAWPHLRDRAVSRFDQEGDDASGAWAELVYTTGLIRSSQGYPAFHPINERSGALRRFITSSHRIAAQGSHGATITMPGEQGNNLMREKISVAQQGGGKKSKNTRFTGPQRPAPARPVLALSVHDEVAITYSLLNWIKVGGP